jgi:Zn-finger nucleic acid-binding protein
MANCCNCGAPLSLKSTVCKYCTSLNDVDLRRKLFISDSIEQMNCTCPRCKCKLLTLDISGNNSFLIERCEQCYGLFFDLGELEKYLTLADTKASEIDHHSLNLLINENYHKEYPVSYIKCPVCEDLMNRINYGKKSGVVVNKCSHHGIWLDSGCLNHLVGWARAGGFELDQIEREEDKKRELNAKKRAAEKSKMSYGDYTSKSEIGLIDVVKMIAKFLT